MSGKCYLDLVLRMAKGRGFRKRTHVCTVHHTLQEISIYEFPEKELRSLIPKFPHLCVCERFIYSHDRSTYFPAAEYADRLWEYINRT
jgi:hypothetical protein